MLPEILEEHETLLGERPSFVVRAPGRVNIIGEHTDYNDGFVLPMAIDRFVWISASPRDDGEVRLYSSDFGSWGGFRLDALEKEGAGWLEYVKGVADSYLKAGYELVGWTGVVDGNIPIGAGLSSSAALELAAARAFAHASGIPWNAQEAAVLCREAENRWVGVNCGIMDQLISAAAVEGHALLIDTLSLEMEPVPLPEGATVVVLDTSTRRGLVDSEYNLRRAQCDAAARFFGVASLRDVSLDEILAARSEMDEVIWKRALHVVTENMRTLGAADAMKDGDKELLGRLMNESHRSLREDFEVSSRELDAIVECARRYDACYGARMTGAGFGGCAVALVESEHVGSFSNHVSKCYLERTGLKAETYPCRAAGGASVVWEA